MAVKEKVWADRPFDLLSISAPEHLETTPHKGSLYLFENMTLAHNNFIRLLNSIYLQASGVKNEKDIIDFLFFCHAWCVMLHEHHGAEEKDFFPRLDEACGEKNVMGHSAEQHGEFTPKINEMHEYVQTVSAQEYSAQKLRAFIDEFGPALRKHLGEEPIALLELGEKFGGEKLAKVWDDFEKKLLAEDLKTWDKHIVLPIAIGATDHTFEGGKYAYWPPLPWFVPYLARFVYSRKHAGSWRFFPCWMMKRRELQFVGDEYLN